MTHGLGLSSISSITSMARYYFCPRIRLPPWRRTPVIDCRISMFYDADDHLMTLYLIPQPTMSSRSGAKTIALDKQGIGVVSTSICRLVRKASTDQTVSCWWDTRGWSTCTPAWHPALRCLIFPFLLNLSTRIKPNRYSCPGVMGL
jgi:hypothetical protein